MGYPVFVLVDRGHKLRICLDPKDLNSAIQRSHYPMPTIEDILPDLHNAKICSLLDARNGFWHVELDEESSLLTCFNSPYGRYRWKRMPFGISQRTGRVPKNVRIRSLKDLKWS